MQPAFSTAVGTMLAVGLLLPTPALAQSPARPVFRSAVDLVSVAVVVRDRRGRLVRHLAREDFEVLDAGTRRSIIEFRAERSAPVSIAVLIDASGSMRLAARLSTARLAVEQLVGALQPGAGSAGEPGDEAALFSFDAALHERHPFTSRPRAIVEALDALDAFGATSLYDAIAAAARHMETRDTERRAVVALTDGVDTTSRLTPAQVSGIASAIDVPVYVLATVSPIDRDALMRASAGPGAVGLDDLARWTGGQLFAASGPSEAAAAVGQILDELRSQYLIAFEAAREPGWRPLRIRTRDAALVVRARSGYMAGQNGRGVELGTASGRSEGRLAPAPVR